MDYFDFEDDDFNVDGIEEELLDNSERLMLRVLNNAASSDEIDTLAGYFVEEPRLMTIYEDRKFYYELNRIGKAAEGHSVRLFAEKP